MIIDINMHWLPSNLFKDKDLLELFVSVVPRQYGEYSKLTRILGTDTDQIIIEKPKGYENLNYAETQYQPENHSITGPLLDGGPAELAQRYGVKASTGYADACHLCYQTRVALRERFPEALAPDQMYGIFA